MSDHHEIALDKVRLFDGLPRIVGTISFKGSKFLTKPIGLEEVNLFSDSLLNPIR